MKAKVTKDYRDRKAVSPIARMRRKMQLDRKELAAKAGMPIPSLVAVEIGSAYHLSRINAERLSRALGVSAGALMLKYYTWKLRAEGIV